jgi:hypothetical protein
MNRIAPTLRLAIATQAAVAFLALIPGCWYRRPTLAPAKAVVTLDDTPVAGASVTLVPIKPGRPAMGTSDADGVVAFSTYGSRDGAPAGTYKAVVVKMVPTKKAVARLKKLHIRKPAEGDDGVEGMMETQDDDYENLLPAKYASIGTTDLAMTIDWTTREIALRLVSAGPGRAAAE